MPDAPADSPEFLAAYAAAAGATLAPVIKDATGTLGAAVVAYLASDAYLGMAASTRQVWRRGCDDIRKQYGAAVLTALQPRHIRKDLARLEPHPANARLKVWRSMARFWVDAGLLDADPAIAVRKRKTPDAAGATPWTRADFDAFRTRWSVGTPERLAFELMYRTCAAIGDMTRLGPAMLSDGYLTYDRRKSGSTATSPFNTPGPDWFEATGDLALCLAAAPRHMTYLTTNRGAARSPKGAASWFAKACTAAGLAGHSAHGIRKGRAAIFAENGAVADQRMAILGHETKEETARYSRSADLRKVIEGAEKFQLRNQFQLVKG